MTDAPVPTPRTIAVTGALGFVAAHLVPRLLARGDRVLAVVRPGREPAVAVLGPAVEPRRGRLDDPATLGDSFAGADAVVHLAGLALVPSLLPAVLASGVRSGVFVSSAGVYTRLVSAGADAKRTGEAALRRSSLAYTILRPSMIYGTARDRNLVRLLRWLQRSPVIPAPLGGSTPQQPVHVDDLVDAILAALDRPVAARREYDVGGPEPITLAQVIHESARALGRKAWILPLPLAPGHATAVFARRVHVPFPVSPEQVLRLAESKAVDIGPARIDLGFAPRDFRTGITEEARRLLAGLPD